MGMNWQAVWLRVQSMGFVVFAAVVAVGIAVFLFLPALHRRHAMQREIQRLDSENIRQEALEKQQRMEIESLKSDPTYVERIARNKLNVVKPNEVVFRFETTPPPAVSTTTKSTLRR